MKMAGAGNRNTEILNGRENYMRGKSYSKKVVYGLFLEEIGRNKNMVKENKRMSTSRYINNINLISNMKNGSNGILQKNNFSIKEEDEFYPIPEFKSEKENIRVLQNNNLFPNPKKKLSNYILQKQINKNQSPKNIIMLNHMQTPMILSDKKLKYFERHKNSSQNGREQKEGIQNYDSRFNQNQKFVKYNKELLKNNIDRYSL